MGFLKDISFKPSNKSGNGFPFFPELLEFRVCYFAITRSKNSHLPGKDCFSPILSLFLLGEVNWVYERMNRLDLGFGVEVIRTKKLGGGVREEGSAHEPPSPHSLAQGGEGGKDCVLYVL